MEDQPTTSASNTATSATTATTTAVSTSTSALDAISVMQSLMTTVVQQALPTLQDNITSSLDSRIQGAMQQQREQLQSWFQHELGSRTNLQVIASQGQGTSTINTSRNNYSGPPVTSIAPIIPSVPTGGNLPLASAIASVPLLQTACSTSALGLSAPSVTMAASWPLTPQTPLTSFLTPADPPSSKSKKAIVIGSSYPPIPYKIAEVIWRDEYLDLAELLPTRLGAPEPTLLELFSGSQNKTARTKKEITNIEEWVLCFNAYIAIVAQKRPERVSDLLAYSSLIVKASRDYEDMPWLAYDQHYRRHAAAKLPTQWGAIQPEIWTLYFGRARAKQRCDVCGEIGHDKCEKSGSTQGDTSLSASQSPTLKGASQQAKKKWSWRESRSQPYERPPPICKRWNRAWGGCRLPDCSFRHVCLECHGNHRELDCQQAKRRQPKSPQGRGQSGVQQ